MVEPTAPPPLERARERAHATAGRWLAGLCRRLAAAGVTPNQVTLASVAGATVAALLAAAGALVAAGVVWLVASALDLVDGALARASGQSTRLGALLDSTMDRVAEGLLLAGIAYRLAADGVPAGAALAVLALLASVLVSYFRARAEALGLDCRGGLATRFERVLLLAAALLTGWLLAGLAVLAVLAGITAVQRARLVWGHAAAQPDDAS